MPTQPHNLPAPGSRLGAYEIVRQAGMGGMGVVYLARDPDLERDVALKVLRPPADPAGSASTTAADRFLREARSAARLNHPNTVAVYQVGRQDGLIYIAMEWVDGGSLSDHLRQSIFLDWRDATAAIRDAAAGLAAAHRAGIIHRDLKPANLMRTRAGLVKVTDFGLARVQDVASDLTLAGTVLGTPAYLAPEQCRGESATAASDVYSLGCTFFHLLTSRTPFEAPNLPALLQCHLTLPFPDARKFADDVPDSVLAVLDRATRRSPAERYTTAEGMLADLEAVLSGRALASSAATVVNFARATAEIPPNAAAKSNTSAPAAAAPGHSSKDDPTVDLPEPAGVLPPSNIPAAPNSFVGRKKEIAEARAMIDQHRLITLVGPGGTGKTRLAQEVARDQLRAFPDGAWIIELAGIAAPGVSEPENSADAPDVIAPAIAAVFSVRPAANQSVISAVIEHLRQRRALLILDNCEHLLAPAAAAARAIIAGCPELRILATTRQPLGLPEEIELRVPALAAPPSGQVMAVAQLARVEAVRLFVDRAALSRPGFAVTEENAAAVADVCRRLDGIPLAIELAAARIKVLSAQQINERLSDAFHLLTTGPRTALPRQRTLRALIDWSYDLLPPAERTVLNRLSVFAGSAALDSAEIVLPGGEIDPADVLDLLAELVDKSLVLMEERDGAARYRMLETIRQYAAEKLAETADDRAGVEARHIDHFAQLAERATPLLSGPDQASWLRRLDVEHDNVRAALDRATPDPARRPAAARLAAAMYQYWLMRGYTLEGVTRYEALIAAGATNENSRTAAKIFNSVSVLLRFRGDTEKARLRVQQGLAVAQALGDPHLEAVITNQLGTLYKDTGDMEKARDVLARVLELRRKIGDIEWVADAANNLGILLMKLPGQRDAARALLAESLAIYERAGNKSWIGYSNLNLGELEYDAGNLAVARSRYAATLSILEAMEDEWGIAYAAEGLGKVELADGNLPLARQHLERAAPILRKLGDKSALSVTLDRLAQLSLDAGDSSGAWPLARQSFAIRLDTGDRLGMAESLETLAAARAHVDPVRAAQFLGSAESLRSQINVPRTPVQERAANRLTAALQSKLGPENYAKALDSGSTLNPADPLILLG